MNRFKKEKVLGMNCLSNSVEKRNGQQDVTHPFWPGVPLGLGLKCDHDFTSQFTISRPVIMLHYCKVKPNAYKLVLPSQVKIIVLTCYGFHIALYWAYVHHDTHFKGKFVYCVCS